jgi:hypothetical protein
MRIPLYYRVEADLQKGDLQKAVRRLEGSLYGDPLNRERSNRLADVYFQSNNLAKAGRYWYFKPNKSEIELSAVQAFKKSLGNDPILILKKLVNQSFLRISLLNNFEVEQLEILLRELRNRQKILPGFLMPLERHLRRRKDGAGINH